MSYQDPQPSQQGSDHNGSAAKRWPKSAPASAVASACRNTDLVDVRHSWRSAEASIRRVRARRLRAVGVCFEKVVDDLFAVKAVDRAQAGESRECNRADELAHDKIDVEVIELSCGGGALEQFGKRLAVVGDDARA